MKQYWSKASTKMTLSNNLDKPFSEMLSVLLASLITFPGFGSLKEDIFSNLLLMLSLFKSCQIKSRTLKQTHCETT